ncbi:hypothetical protein D9M72_473520 [compost metagenome]
MAEFPVISDFESVLYGLKKSKTPLLLVAQLFSKAIIFGLEVTSIAKAPAPCVYSPVEFKSYFAISVVTTIAFFSGFNRIKSRQFCKASTPPIQAKVKSTASHSVSKSAPNFSSIRDNKNEAIGLELSMPLSVPT